MTAKALTGNRLDDGLVVFLTRKHTWSLDVSEAWVAENDAEIAALEEQLSAAAAGTAVTDVYLFDMERVDGALRPAHIRERIRTLGPTVRTDLGKQADGTSGAFCATG
ncbi:MAG: DUF2849 domain-containing protein [Hyphomicrobiales bacterium]